LPTPVTEVLIAVPPEYTNACSGPARVVSERVRAALETTM
jgi:hypothetical protein